MTQNLLRFSFAAALALFLTNGLVRAADTDQLQQAEPTSPACIDGMEEIPYTDDGEAIPVSDDMTGGCQVSDDTIAT